MKNLIAVLALSFTLVPAQTLSKLIAENKGQSVFLFGSAPNGEPQKGSAVNLDTSEADTSKYFYDLIEKPVLYLSDTVGYVHFQCKDSTGTDSMGVRLFWQGNSRPDGGGLWATIDSVSLLGASASNFVNVAPAPVVNAKGYQAIRFIAKNIKNSAVGLKAVCKDFVLNRPRRLGTPN